MIDFDLKSGGKIVFVHPGVWTLIGPNAERLELQSEAILDDDGEPAGECYSLSLLTDTELARIGKSRDSLMDDLEYIATLADEQVEFR